MPAESWLSPLESRPGPIKSCLPPIVPALRPQHALPCIRRQGGLTLIELIVAIVIVAVAATAVLGVLSYNAAHSADAMVTSQAVSIAQAYLEEITLKSFDDPNGIEPEANRGDFDDVHDYAGLVDAGAVDQFGNPIAGLERYNVAVSVTPSAALPNVPAADAVRIDVRVSLPPYADVRLTGYKTRL